MNSNDENLKFKSEVATKEVESNKEIVRDNKIKDNNKENNITDEGKIGEKNATDDGKTEEKNITKDNKEKNVSIKENSTSNESKTQDSINRIGVIKEEEKNNENKKSKNQEKNKIEQDKGEIYKSACRLYRLDTKRNEIVGRGIGKVMILYVPETKLYKIVMERDVIKRLGCNHYVDPNCEIEKHSKYENTWTWSTKHDKIDDIETGTEQTFIIRFSNENDSNLFKEKYDFAKEHNLKTLKGEK